MKRQVAASEMQRLQTASGATQATLVGAYQGNVQQSREKSAVKEHFFNEFGELLMNKCGELVMRTLEVVGDGGIPAHKTKELVTNSISEMVDEMDVGTIEKLSACTHVNGQFLTEFFNDGGRERFNKLATKILLESRPGAPINKVNTMVTRIVSMVEAKKGMTDEEALNSSTVATRASFN